MRKVVMALKSNGGLYRMDYGMMIDPLIGAKVGLSGILPSGLTLLNIAIGTGNFALTERLIALGVEFVPDSFGRMPSTMAVLCGADEKLCDLVMEAEMKALGDD